MPTETFQTIDAEVDILDDKLRQLKMHRNSLTKLCALPVEVLLQIVHHFHDDVRFADAARV